MRRAMAMLSLVLAGTACGGAGGGSGQAPAGSPSPLATMTEVRITAPQAVTFRGTVQCAPEASGELYQFDLRAVGNTNPNFIFALTLNLRGPTGRRVSVHAVSATETTHNPASASATASWVVPEAAFDYSGALEWVLGPPLGAVIWTSSADRRSGVFEAFLNNPKYAEAHLTGSWLC